MPLVTARLPNVPTVVKLLVTTVAFNVVPVSVPAAAVTVMSALPLKLTPLMFRAVVSVAADPLTDPVIVFVTDKFVKVPTDVRLLAVTPDANVFPVSVPAAAVTVPEAPNAIAVPFTVTVLLDNLLLAIEPANIVFVTVAVSVLYIPLVTVPALPDTVPVTFPVKLAVIILAAKLPELSRLTIVLTLDNGVAVLPNVMAPVD